MADKITGKEAKLSRLQWMLLYAFPVFLGSIAALVAGPGWPSYVYLLMGLLVGYAVVRGIEAAIGPPPSLTPLADWILLREIRERAKGAGEQQQASQPQQAPRQPTKENESE